MNYMSVVDFESERMPGLKCKLRKMSNGRRNDFRIATANVISEIQLKREPLEKMFEDLKTEDPKGQGYVDQEKAITVLQNSIWNELIVGKLYPAYIKWGVAEFSGDICVNGDPVTLANFFELPDEVIVELGGKIDTLVNLTFEQQLLFKWPTTLSAPVDGQTNDTSAQPAD